eukprot:6181377-Pleurochrysis_carterae.AAC.2
MRRLSHVASEHRLSRTGLVRSTVGERESRLLERESRRLDVLTTSSRTHSTLHLRSEQDAVGCAFGARVLRRPWRALHTDSVCAPHNGSSSRAESIFNGLVLAKVERMSRD